MKKHAGKEREERLGQSVAVTVERQLDLCGNDGVGIYEDLCGVRRKRDLVNEDRDICKNEKQGDDGKGAPSRQVLQRDQSMVS